MGWLALDQHGNGSRTIYICPKGQHFNKNVVSKLLSRQGEVLELSDGREKSEGEKEMDLRGTKRWTEFNPIKGGTYSNLVLGCLTQST